VITLAIGGPHDQQILSEDSLVLWQGKRPSYFRRLIRNGTDIRHLYLHRTLIHHPPDPEAEIRKFIATPDRLSDPAVIAHHWWLAGDLARFHYARFL